MSEKRQQLEKPAVDLGRRRALKKLGKAAYIAPTVTLIPMDSLADFGNACSNVTPDVKNPNCLTF